MFVGYKKLDYVLNFIPKEYQEMLGDTEQWLSWALQYLRTLNEHQRYFKAPALLEIVNHQACLPKGLRKIEMIKMHSVNSDLISFTNGELNTNTIPSFLWQGEEVEINYSEAGISIYHQLVQAASLSSTSDWIPMRYVGNTNQKNMFSSSCWNTLFNPCGVNCYNEFSITPDHCLLTEAKEGVICIWYQSEAKDEDGNFIVPEDPIHLWMALAFFAIGQFWLSRTAFDKSGEAMNKANDFLFKANIWMREAKGIFKQRNFSIKSLMDVMYRDQDIIRSKAVFKNY
jgi:hypothetical protein